MLFVRVFLRACVALALIGVALADTPSVPDSKPLSATEIRELLKGRTFEFVGYDQPITGKAEWNFETGIVSGSYIWEESEESTFETEMFIKDDKLCTIQKKGVICQIAYRYEDGFMEVTPEGVVHAVSRPGS